MPKKQIRLLDPTLKSDNENELLETLRNRVVGQEEAVVALSDAYTMYKAGLCDPDRPIANLIFLGTSGSGKTLSLEIMSEVLFGTRQALLKVDCASFQHSHEIAKLTGCFVEGTRVLLSNGAPKPIEEIAVGDLVITKDGGAKPVTSLYQYKHEGPLVKLVTGNSNIPIVCTPQHNILAIKQPFIGRRGKTVAERDLKQLYNPEKLTYIPAGELKRGDVVVYPRHKFAGKEVVIDLAEYAKQLRLGKYDDTHVWVTARRNEKRMPRFIKVDKDFMRLAGFYVSEGGHNSTKRDSINFTFGRHTMDGPCVHEVEHFLTTLFGGHFQTKTRESSYRIYYSSQIVCLLMIDLFGNHALRKQVPDWFCDLQPELLWEFLDTAILGDGGKTIKRRIDYSTSSPKLAYQLRFIIQSLGFSTPMHIEIVTKRRGPTVSPRFRLYVSGEQIAQFAQHLPVTGKSINLLNVGNRGIQRMAHVDEDYVYTRIKKVEEITYKGLIYDFSVDEKTSYVVETMIVSNSPSGYIGHNATPAYFAQENLDKSHTPENPLTLLLFDEIEKADDALWELLLSILDKATITLGTNKTTSFSKCIIVMTGNLGAREIQYLIKGGMGFGGSSSISEKELDKNTNKAAIEAARRRFTPEFLNRIDEIVVFHPLGKAELEKVVDIELAQVQARILRAQNDRQFVLDFTPKARAFILDKGTDIKNGARPLKRAIEKHITKRLACFLNTHQIAMGDSILVDVGKDGNLKFTCIEEGVLVKADLQEKAAV